MAGQINKRSKDSYSIRVFMGRDPETGKRNYLNKTIQGNKKDAEKALTALLRQRDLGELLLEPTRMTVREYLEYWLDTAARPRLRERTFQDYQGLLNRHVLPNLGSTRLTKVTPMEVQAVYGEMLTRGLSARTVRYCHAVFSNALSQAVKWRLLARNPARHVDLPKQHRKEMHAMTPAEVKRFLSAAGESRHHALFALLVATGMRPGEAVALRWSDLNAVASTISVNRTVAHIKGGFVFQSPKTRRSRRQIKLPENLTRLLLDHYEVVGDDDLIFPSEAGTPLDVRNLASQHFKPILERAGLDRSFRLYDLRHTHATLLLLAGINPKIVSERLGHASVVLTLDTYSHVLPGMQDESAEKLNEMLFESDQATAAIGLLPN